MRYFIFVFSFFVPALASSKLEIAFPAEWKCGSSMVLTLKNPSPRSKSLAVVARDKSTQAVEFFAYDINPRTAFLQLSDPQAQLMRGVTSDGKTTLALPCKAGGTFEIAVLGIDSSPKFFAPPTYKDFEVTIANHTVEKVSKDVVMK